MKGLYTALFFFVFLVPFAHALESVTLNDPTTTNRSITLTWTETTTPSSDFAYYKILRSAQPNFTDIDSLIPKIPTLGNIGSIVLIILFVYFVFKKQRALSVIILFVLVSLNLNNTSQAEVQDPLLSISFTFKTTEQFKDTCLNPDTTYYYKVYVFDDYGNYIASNEVSGSVTTGGCTEEYKHYGEFGSDVLTTPTGIAYDPSGYLYVVDRGNSRIRKFDLTGNLIFTIGSLGNNDGEFETPMDIDLDSEGNFYVADSTRVQKFDTNGNFMLSWNASINTGIAIDKSSDFLYGRTTIEVYKYTIGGTLIKSWSAGSSSGSWDLTDIAVDSNGDIYIADAGNRKILKYDSDGNFILEWGSLGEGDGEFYNVFGIAIDNDNNVYVVNDNQNNTATGIIQKFDSSGNFISKWGENGTQAGQLTYARGIVIDNDGLVYVSEKNYTNRIQVFKYY